MLPEPLIGRWDAGDGGGVLSLEAGGAFRRAPNEGSEEHGLAKVDGPTIVLDSAQGPSSFQWLVDDAELVLIGRDGTVVRYERAG